MGKGRRAEALRLLGLARRAGAVAPGTDATRRAIREGEARLVLVAKDASSVQLKKVRTTLRERAIPQVVLGDRDALGSAVGLGRVSAMAVTNRSFADRLLETLGGDGDGRSTDDLEA